MKEIKLKKIKPNTAIHCTDKEQIEYLVKNKIVDVWALEKGVPVWLASYKDNRIHSWMPEHDGKQTGEEYYKSVGLICIEFSDLILPETMTEEEAYKKGREDAFEEVRNCEAYGYDCGLKDAWELARKIALNTYDGGIDGKELEVIFGTHDSYTIFKDNTVTEALVKLEAYEKEKNKIKVGDVVQTYNAREYVVIATSEEMPNNQPLLRNLYDNSVCFGTNDNLIKTGKHINISAILAEIGKE